MTIICKALVGLASEGMITMAHQFFFVAESVVVSYFRCIVLLLII